ncbi:hypothetical protein [Bacillus licheniformis]|uniref:hypothetical protein n=1 Tax=Bacillus licheniformis TaxID=1402 RepID=UPI0037166BEF
MSKVVIRKREDALGNQMFFSNYDVLIDGKHLKDMMDRVKDIEIKLSPGELPVLKIEVHPEEVEFEGYSVVGIDVDLSKMKFVSETALKTAKIKDLSADKIIAGTIKPPSNKPLTPAVCAQPLFTKIYLSWTHDPDIDHYEVYGSREPGFATTYCTLLLKSKTHEFVHEVGVNERWFYRVRAIGKNGIVGDFTEEVSAKTVKPWYSSVAAKTLPEVVEGVFSEWQKKHKTKLQTS